MQSKKPCYSLKITHTIFVLNVLICKRFENFMRYFKEQRVFWESIMMNQVQECIRSEKGTNITLISFNLFHFMAHFVSSHTKIF